MHYIKLAVGYSCTTEVGPQVETVDQDATSAATFDATAAAADTVAAAAASTEPSAFGLAPFSCFENPTWDNKSGQFEYSPQFVYMNSGFMDRKGFGNALFTVACTSESPRTQPQLTQMCLIARGCARHPVQ